MDRAALWRLLGEMRPHRRAVILVLLSAIVSIASASAVPTLIQMAIDGPVARGDRAGVVHIAAVGVALAVVEFGLTWQRRRSLALVSTRVETDLRDRLYARLQSLDIGFHDRWQSGQLVQRCIGDLSTMRRFVGFGAIFFVILLLQVVFIAVLLALKHVPLTLFTFVTAVPVFVLIRRQFATYEAVSRHVQELEGDLASVVEESATGLRAIKAFGRRPLVVSQFSAAADDVLQAKLTRVRLRTRFSWILGFIPKVIVGVVLGAGAVAVGNGSMSVGDLVAFVFYVLMLRWPLEALGWILAMAEEARTAAARLYEVLDTEPAIVDPVSPASLPTRPSGRLVFEDVHFAYPTAPDSEILKGVDLVVEPGETVAIVGATGSGKSTIGMLVPRLYDVSSGRVTIDGVDVRDLRLPELRRNVGVAFEDATLFSMSVRENLRLGKADADDDDIWDALGIAHAAEFVAALPWGLDTRIGEQGMSLSGGQRQRLALARAVIARPPVLVLDDPLSALDVHTEAAVEAALESVLADATALVVVHRPSTVALADRAALVWEGRIAAVGEHGRLMATDERYRSILAAEVEDLDTVLLDVADPAWPDDDEWSVLEQGEVRR